MNMIRFYADLLKFRHLFNISVRITMKKLLLGAAVSAALFAGHASAAITALPTIGTGATQSIDFSTTTGVGLAANIKGTAYFSGSSAATPFLEKSILNLAAAGSKVYKYYDSGKEAFTYYFTTGATVPAGSGLTAGNNYVVHKRDKGGSVTGVLAASGNAANIATVTYNTTLPTVTGSLGQVAATVFPCAAPATLSTTAANLVPCTGATAIALAVPPVGTVSVNLADVDAAQFASALNGATATNSLATLAPTIASNPVATQIFGVALTLKLRNAMQTAAIASGALPATCTAGNETEACMPSLTSAQITALFATGRFNDWTNFGFNGTATGNLVAANGTNVPGNPAVHICSRTAGSGTLATTQVLFENAPCNGTVSEAIQSPAALTIAAEGAAGATKAYHATTSSGELESCLETLDGYNATTATSGTTMVANSTFTLPTFLGTANFRWAVGILNTDRNITNALPYRFVKIDGYSPSAANVAAGKYNFWSELSTVGTVPTVTSNPLGFGLLQSMTSPATIALANVTNPAFGVTGYLGTAANATYKTAIAPGTLINAAFEATRPVNPFTHMVGAGTAGTLNHCRSATILSGTKSLPGLN